MERWNCEFLEQRSSNAEKVTAIVMIEVKIDGHIWALAFNQYVPGVT